jgi:hypothetical protein
MMLLGGGRWGKSESGGRRRGGERRVGAEDGDGEAEGGLPWRPTMATGDAAAGGEDGVQGSNSQLCPPTPGRSQWAEAQHLGGWRASEVVIVGSSLDGHDDLTAQYSQRGDLQRI